MTIDASIQLVCAPGQVASTLVNCSPLARVLLLLPSQYNSSHRFSSIPHGTSPSIPRPPAPPSTVVDGLDTGACFCGCQARHSALLILLLLDSWLGAAGRTNHLLCLLLPFPLDLTRDIPSATKLYYYIVQCPSIDWTCTVPLSECQ